MNNCLALWFITAVTCFTPASNWQTPTLKLCQLLSPYGPPRWLSGKEYALSSRKLAFDPWVRKMPWRKKWHSSVLACEVSWTEEPGGLQSTGSQSWTLLRNYTTTTAILSLLFCGTPSFWGKLRTRRVVGCRVQGCGLLCPLLGAVCLSLQSFSLQEASVLSSPLPLSSAADTRVSSFRESRMSPAVSSSGFTLPPSPKGTVLVFTPLLPF